MTDVSCLMSLMTLKGEPRETNPNRNGIKEPGHESATTWSHEVSEQQVTIIQEADNKVNANKEENKFGNLRKKITSARSQQKAREMGTTNKTTTSRK